MSFQADLSTDFYEVKFSLDIRGYTKSERISWDDKWCNVDCSVKCGDWLEWSLKNDEALLCCEIEELCENLEKLLDDRIAAILNCVCIEPYFSFAFHPKLYLRDNPQQVYLAPGQEYIDVYFEWIIGNIIHLKFDRTDSKMLLQYLKGIIN